jgi:hypothetical protein
MTRLLWRYRRLYGRRFGAGLTVLALCFGLAVQAWTPQTLFAGPDTDLATLFGEHALCLAAGHGEAPATPGDQQNGPSHDHHLCCLFHANFGFPPPPAPPAPTRLALVSIIAPLPDATAPTPRLPTGAARARAPPTEA